MSSSTVFLVTLSITHLRADVDVVPEIDYPHDMCLPRSHNHQRKKRDAVVPGVMSGACSDPLAESRAISLQKSDSSPGRALASAVHGDNVRVGSPCPR